MYVPGFLENNNYVTDIKFEHWIEYGTGTHLTTTVGRNEREKHWVDVMTPITRFQVHIQSLVVWIKLFLP